MWYQISIETFDIFDLFSIIHTILSSFFPPSEDRQKKNRQQKEKRSAEGKTSLQRSKTFVNLLFKKDRKEKSRFKSPSHHQDKGEGTVTGQFFSFPGSCSAISKIPKVKCSLNCV